MIALIHICIIFQCFAFIYFTAFSNACFVAFLIPVELNVCTTDRIYFCTLRIQNLRYNIFRHSQIGTIFSVSRDNIYLLNLLLFTITSTLTVPPNPSASPVYVPSL